MSIWALKILGLVPNSPQLTVILGSVFSKPLLAPSCHIASAPRAASPLALTVMATGELRASLLALRLLICMPLGYCSDPFSALQKSGMAVFF